MHQAVILNFVSNRATPDSYKELWSIDLARDPPENRQT